MNVLPDSRSGIDWEERARSFQTDSRGVLFKSLPPLLNQYLHDWHVAEVLRVVDQSTPSARFRVLDLGCGYGRLSRALHDARPEAQLVGMDISRTFARLYRQETGGAAVVSDLNAALPVGSESFDLILMVTALMYLSPASRQRLMRDALRALKPAGRLVIVETSRRGARIYSGFGARALLAKIAGFVDNSVRTNGHLFAYPEIESLVAESGGSVARRSGVVLFTVLFPILFVLDRIGARGFAERLLRRCRPWPGIKKHSLHICYEVSRLAPTVSEGPEPGRYAFEGVG